MPRPLPILFGCFPQVPLLPPPPPGGCSIVTPVDLPEEVLQSIFERLSSARDIAAVRGVCCSWRELVDRTATIWRELVFELPKGTSNVRQAETWYRKAAQYGNSQAQFLLALLYSYGYPAGSYRYRNQRNTPHLGVLNFPPGTGY